MVVLTRATEPDKQRDSIGTALELNGVGWLARGWCCAGDRITVK